MYTRISCRSCSCSAAIYMRVQPCSCSAARQCKLLYVCVYMAAPQLVVMLTVIAMMHGYMYGTDMIYTYRYSYTKQTHTSIYSSLVVSYNVQIFVRGLPRRPPLAGSCSNQRKGHHGHAGKPPLVGSCSNHRRVKQGHAREPPLVGPCSCKRRVQFSCFAAHAFHMYSCPAATYIYIYKYIYGPTYTYTCT